MERQCHPVAGSGNPQPAPYLSSLCVHAAASALPSLLPFSVLYCCYCKNITIIKTIKKEEGKRRKEREGRERGRGREEGETKSFSPIISLSISPFAAFHDSHRRREGTSRPSLGVFAGGGGSEPLLHPFVSARVRRVAKATTNELRSVCLNLFLSSVNVNCLTRAMSFPSRPVGFQNGLCVWVCVEKLKSDKNHKSKCRLIDIFSKTVLLIAELEVQDKRAGVTIGLEMVVRDQ